MQTARSGSLPTRRRVPGPLLGMILFVASEAMFFGALISSFFAVGGGAALHEGRELETVIPVAITFLLLASSATAHRAQHAARAGDPAGARRWLVPTIVLGAAFLAGQIVEYQGLGFALAEDASTTLFFTLTGFHGLHVFGGILLLAAIAARAADLNRADSLGGRTEAAVLYWHFVDVVWILLVTSLYLIR